jgi:uncharacterized protein (TIGR02421 family)
MPASQSPSPAEHIADRVLSRIDSQLHLVPWLTPTNLEAQKTKFFAGTRPNPVFTYARPTVNLTELEKALRGVSIPRSDMGELLQQKAEELRIKIALVKSIGTSDLTGLSQTLYGVPDPRTVSEAKEVLKKPRQTPEQKETVRLTSGGVVKTLQDVLLQYGLDGWKVETSNEIISGVVVSTTRRKVLVRKNTVLDLSRLAPIITHEIETHVLTAFNGAQQPLEIFRQGFAGYLRTQEGLAAYNVTTQHPNLGRPLRFWARNALAVDLALRHSFADVFSAVRELGFDENFAFGVTVKVKRGLSDTSLPGAFTKDYLYLAGRRDVRVFIEEGGNIRDLYAGKIHLPNIDQVLKLPWLKKATKLPGFLSERVT